MRREVLCRVLLATVFVAIAMVCRAQELTTLRRVGFLASGNVDTAAVARDAFLRGMRQLGYVDGSNVVIAYRYWGNDVAAIPALVDELVRSGIEVIVMSNVAAALAAKAVTSTTPIVVLASGDFVRAGLVESLAKPGGNVTGITTVASDLIGKRVQLLKETMPQAARLAVLKNSENLTHPDMLGAAVAAADALGVSTRAFDVRGPDELDAAFTAMAAWQADAVLVLDDAMANANRVSLNAAAAQQRLPLVCGFRPLVEVGCLFSYAAAAREQWEGAAAYVDRILKGESPSELPVGQPTRYELIVNGKAAKALGILITPLLAAQADEVID